MTNRGGFRAYGRMSPEDQRAFDRWLAANAVVGSIFAAALLVMALAGTNVAGPTQAAAEGRATTGQSAARSDQRGLSPTELTIRIAPDQLPVQQYSPF